MLRSALEMLLTHSANMWSETAMPYSHVRYIKMVTGKKRERSSLWRPPVEHYHGWLCHKFIVLEILSVQVLAGNRYFIQIASRSQKCWVKKSLIKGSINMETLEEENIFVWEELSDKREKNESSGFPFLSCASVLHWSGPSRDRYAKPSWGGLCSLGKAGSGWKESESRFGDLVEDPAQMVNMQNGNLVTWIHLCSRRKLGAGGAVLVLSGLAVG